MAFKSKEKKKKAQTFIIFIMRNLNNPISTSEVFSVHEMVVHLDDIYMVSGMELICL